MLSPPGNRDIAIHPSVYEAREPLVLSRIAEDDLASPLCDAWLMQREYLDAFQRCCSRAGHRRILGPAPRWHVRSIRQCVTLLGQFQEHCQVVSGPANSPVAVAVGRNARKGSEPQTCKALTDPRHRRRCCSTVWPRYAGQHASVMPPDGPAGRGQPVALGGGPAKTATRAHERGITQRRQSMLNVHLVQSMPGASTCVPRRLRFLGYHSLYGGSRETDRTATLRSDALLGLYLLVGCTNRQDGAAAPFSPRPRGGGGRS